MKTSQTASSIEGQLGRRPNPYEGHARRTAAGEPLFAKHKHLWRKAAAPISEALRDTAANRLDELSATKCYIHPHNARYAPTKRERQ